MQSVLAAVCVFTLLASLWSFRMHVYLRRRHRGFKRRPATLALVVAVLAAFTLYAIRIPQMGLALRVAVISTGVWILTYGVIRLRRNHLARHFEGFALITGAVLVLQGALTLWFATHV